MPTNKKWNADGNECGTSWRMIVLQDGTKRPYSNVWQAVYSSDEVAGQVSAAQWRMDTATNI